MVIYGLNFTLFILSKKKIEGFHVRILRIKEEINISVENVSPTRLLLQYTKALSKSDKIRALIAPKMTDLITFIDNNRKSDIYTGGDIHGIYRYLEMIGPPTTLTNSG